VSRPSHSFGAHVRALQISRFSLFAFVEGKDIDPNFFGQVCSRVCEPRGLLYRILTARELPGGSGGKTRLITFYRHVRSKKQLRAALNGKVSILLFFLDKDVDDIRRTKCRSKHVVYTAYYDVQNYVFRHGDFTRSVSAAASIDPRELSEAPLFRGNWCETAARRWKEWVVLCLFSAVHSGRPVANYRSASTVNAPKNGPLDPRLYAAQLLEARNSSGLTEAQFNRTIEQLTDKVERHLSNGTHDLVFKGKWYGAILEMDLHTAFPGRGQMQNVGTRATAALLATLDFNREWLEHLLIPVVALLDES
jgi:hypothetical protein